MPHPAADAFAALGLPPPIAQGIAELGFDAPTPIQAAAIPALLAGGDLVGRARTGSGKTLAYAAPLLAGLRLADRRVQGLVVCPTRELTAQVTAEVRTFGRRLPGLRVVTVVGGVALGPQARALAEGAHVVVGTPGRLVDHLRRGTLAVDAVEVLVLDEADKTLALGFADEVDALLDALPASRRTALFSATYPDGVAALVARRLPGATVVEVDAELALEAYAVAVGAGDAAKDAALDHLLRALAPARAIVFCNRVRTAAAVAEALAAAGFAAEGLHGDLAPRDRERVMAKLRNGSTRVLVATDVASRGLDIAGLDLVVNRDVPEQPEDYVHRVGRTGRAGQSGVAWTLVAPGDRLGAAGLGDLRRAALPTLPAGAPPLAADHVTVSIGAGRRDKLRPGDVLGALTAPDVGLVGADVGRIEVHDRHTWVALPAGTAAAAVRALGRARIKGRRVRVDLVP